MSFVIVHHSCRNGTDYVSHPSRYQGVTTDYSQLICAEELACYYAWTGEVDQAITWLDIAFELSPSGVEPRVLESALFARITTGPEFQREMERVRSMAWERVKRASRTALP